MKKILTSSEVTIGNVVPKGRRCVCAPRILAGFLAVGGETLSEGLSCQINGKTLG